jgi:tRNA-binding EMAP/Myf-like protein
MDISLDATKYIKKLTKDGYLYNEFANKKDFSPVPIPVTVFMAGSPGAGKTETSKQLIAELSKYVFQKKEIIYPIVRIDADEIRKLCPGYNGYNAHLFQRAVSLGVDKLIDYVNKKKYNALVDGTFATDKSISNIDIAIKKGREIYIYYIYQEPLKAWEFTLKREKLHSRKITKEAFVNAFIKARENVNNAKNLYKEKVNLNVIIKNYVNNIEKIYMNVQSIDNYVEFDYNEQTLSNIIKDVNI